MSDSSSPVPWSDEQWARATQVIQEEAQRARVAAGFLPLLGPLPASSDFVRAEVMHYGEAGEAPARMSIDDTHTILLPTLQVKVYLRGAQMADPEMSSALQMFRRAANVLARVEDAIVFNGQADRNQGPRDRIDGLPAIWQVLGGEPCRGLYRPEGKPPVIKERLGLGERLVSAVSNAIGELESNGHFGPFAVALDHRFFTAVQTPNPSSLVLPQDRIIPFLGGGALVRASTLPPDSGVIIALGAAPVELVVATDVSLNFLQVTQDPMFCFRVFEKVRLRIKEADAIRALVPAAA